MRSTALLLASLLTLPVARADDAAPAEGHEAFIEGLRGDKSASLVKGVEAKSASSLRSLSPVVSRFKGWFIDLTERAEKSKLGGVDVVSGISLASKTSDASYWQFVETGKGWLVVSAGGKYKGWVLSLIHI